MALNSVGGIATSQEAYQKSIRFLLRTQFDDGSWYVRSRAWPFQPHFESEFPHGKDHDRPAKLETRPHQNFLASMSALE